MQAQKLFKMAAICGGSLLITSLCLLANGDSPYQFGRVTIPWFLVQVASAVLLLVAGGQGGVITHQDLDYLRRLRSGVGVGIVFLGLVFGLVIIILIMAFTNNAPHLPPTDDDTIAVWVARAFAALSLCIGALALYYHWWVLARLSQEEQKGE